MLRRSELAALTLGDVAQLGPQGRVTITVRSSKTDQQGVGAEVPLPAFTRGSKIPIGRIVARYVTWRRAAGGRDADPFFTAVGRPRSGWHGERLVH